MQREKKVRPLAPGAYAGARRPVAADTAKLARIIKKLSANFPQIQIAYLYGSSLTRKDFKDVDLALGLRGRSKPRLDSIGFRIKISTLLRRAARCANEFDVHLLHEMPLSLQYRVISTGKCVFMRSAPEKINYETGVLNQFLDFKPTHDWLVRRTLERASQQR